MLLRQVFPRCYLDRYYQMLVRQILLSACDKLVLACEAANAAFQHRHVNYIRNAFQLFHAQRWRKSFVHFNFDLLGLLLHLQEFSLNLSFFLSSWPTITVGHELLGECWSGSTVGAIVGEIAREIVGDLAGEVGLRDPPASLSAPAL